MSIYETVDDLVSDILGQSYHVKTEPVPDAKGIGSVQTRFIITPSNKDNVDSDRDSIHIFAKQNDMESPLQTLIHVVDKESIMYDKVIPLALKFLSERDTQLFSDMKSLLPHYYGRGIVSSQHTFLFQDLFYSRSGEKFKVNASDSFHDDDTVCLIMESIAKLHGVFHSIKNVPGFNFKEEYPILAEDFLLDKKSHGIVAPFYNGEFHKSWAILQVVLDNYNTVQSKLSLCHENLPEIREALNNLKLLVKEPLKLLGNTRRRENPDTSILIHGDFHPLNIAVSDSAVKFFDFQLIRYSDGLSDVHQYLCQGTTPKQRSEKLTRYLEIYHETLTVTCQKLGMSGSPYGDFERFMAEYQKLTPLQIPYGFGMLIWKYVTDFKAYEELAGFLKALEFSSSSEKTILHEDILKCIDKMGPKIWEAIQTLFEFVLEINNNGILDQCHFASDTT